MNPATAVEKGGSTMETKTYRGRSLDEILPRIKAELGPDAVIMRQRNGLTGGVGGFFQRECIEVEASPAARRFDAYDEQPEPDRFVPDELPVDAATSEGLSSRAIQEMLSQAAPFAEHLSLAESSAFDDRAEPPTGPVSERVAPTIERQVEPHRASERVPPAPARAHPVDEPDAPMAGEQVEPPARPAGKLERSLVAAGLDAA